MVSSLSPVVTLYSTLQFSHPKMLLCIFGLSVSSIFLQTHVIVIVGNLIGFNPELDTGNWAQTQQLD